MKNLFQPILFLLLLVFTGCSTQKFFDIEPENKDYDYYEGRKIITKSDADIEASLNYEFQEHGNFVFYLYVENNSDEYITVDPENIISLNTGDKFNKEIVYAVNPETEIERIENKMEELDDSHAANVGLNCLFATFNVVADIADGEGDDAIIDAGYWATEMENEGREYEYNSDKLAESKLFWENEVLRITTLYPNEEIGGLVFFPIIPDAEKLIIIIDIGEVEFEFPFRQFVR